LNLTLGEAAQWWWLGARPVPKEPCMSLMGIGEFAELS
jgi:hypothetical protein